MLLPNPAPSDMVALLADLGIEIIWKDGATFHAMGSIGELLA